MGFSEAMHAWGLVSIVFLAVLGSEAVSYAFVYRRADYKRACARVRDLTKKYEKEEGKLVPVDKRKVHERTITRLEEEVKDATSKMNWMKMRSTIATSIGFFLLYRSVATSYGGIVIARLPFVPFKMLQSFTHRGLSDEDVYACGFGFIYSLATMAFKQNLPKALGFAPPRSAYDPSKAAARLAAKADFE